VKFSASLLGFRTTLFPTTSALSMGIIDKINGSLYDNMIKIFPFGFILFTNSSE